MVNIFDAETLLHQTRVPALGALLSTCIFGFTLRSCEVGYLTDERIVHAILRERVPWISQPVGERTR